MSQGLWNQKWRPAKSFSLRTRFIIIVQHYYSGLLRNTWGGGDNASFLRDSPLRLKRSKPKM